MSSSGLSVEIEVVNKTQNITLRNPRTHFYTGLILHDPEDLVPPGSSSSCKFIRSNELCCSGVLAYEADSFTMAIYFFNGFPKHKSPVMMALELSLDKVHSWNLEATLRRLDTYVQSSPDSYMLPCVILKGNQQKAQLGVGPISVTVTMVSGLSTDIKVEVQGNSGGGAGIGTL